VILSIVTLLCLTAAPCIGVVRLSASAKVKVEGTGRKQMRAERGCKSGKNASAADLYVIARSRPVSGFVAVTVVLATNQGLEDVQAA